VWTHAAATIKGGLEGQVISVTPVTTPEAWCEYYGIAVSDGVAVLFKGVDAKYRSPRGAVYAPGTTPEAIDWDGGMVECGGGLHFSPSPRSTLEFATDAVKFVACPVRLSDMRPPKETDLYPAKIKARCVACPCFEVDRWGDPVAAKEGVTT